jgi:hypothetical protein
MRPNTSQLDDGHIEFVRTRLQVLRCRPRQCHKRLGSENTYASKKLEVHDSAFWSKKITQPQSTAQPLIFLYDPRSDFHTPVQEARTKKYEKKNYLQENIFFLFLRSPHSVKKKGVANARRSTDAKPPHKELIQSAQKCDVQEK